MATKSTNDGMLASKPTTGEVMKETKKPEFEQYQIESAASDIQRAHEHMTNPKLMKHVRKHLVSKKKAVDSMMAALPPGEEDNEPVSSLAQLRKKRNKTAPATEE
jgi:hypothetical protein